MWRKTLIVLAVVLPGVVWVFFSIKSQLVHVVAAMYLAPLVTVSLTGVSVGWR